MGNLIDELHDIADDFSAEDYSVRAELVRDAIEEIERLRAVVASSQSPSPTGWKNTSCNGNPAVLTAPPRSLDGGKSPHHAIDGGAANLDGMAEASRVIASKHLVLGDEVKAAYWRGRARGLQLAAHNLHLSPTMPLTDEEAA